MSLKKIALATTLALSGSLATAADISYDYVGIGFTDQDELSGATIEGSYSFNNDFYARADIALLSDNGVDSDVYIVNLGYKMPISSSTDFIAEIGYLRNDQSFAGTSTDDSGYNALIGVRSMMTREFEVGANIQHIDIFDSTNAVINLEGRYHFNKQLSAAVEVSFNEDGDDAVGVNLRYNF